MKINKPDESKQLKQEIFMEIKNVESDIARKRKPIFESKVNLNLQ